MSAYEYKPLESTRHIRLLKLSPRTESNIDQAYPRLSLVADIKHFCLDGPDIPPYEPVSWVWAGCEPKSYLQHNTPERPQRRSSFSVATGSTAPTDPTDGAIRDQVMHLVDGRCMTLSRSLCSALPYLSTSSETGYLWIDQLCINQDDLLERGGQVSIMHQIYNSGQRTLIWLGPDTVDMEFLRRVRDGIKGTGGALLPGGKRRFQKKNKKKHRRFDKEAEKRPEYKIGRGLKSSEWDTKIEEAINRSFGNKKTELEEFANKLKAALYGLWRRPWVCNLLSLVFKLPAHIRFRLKGRVQFGRVWVLQEAIHSKTFIFLAGLHLYDEKDLICAWNLARGCNIRLGLHPESGCYYSCGMTFRNIQIVRKATKTPSLNTYLRQNRNRGMPKGASDPRDHIYALLNLSKDDPWRPTADYTLCTAQVFATATKYCFKYESGLEMWHWRNWPYGLDDSETKDQVENLPSWAHDFSRSRQSHPTLFSGPVTYSRSPFQASAGRKFDPHPNIPYQVLVVRGSIIDTVVWVDKESTHWDDPVLYKAHGRDLLGLKAMSKRLNAAVSGTGSAPVTLTRLVDVVSHGVRLAQNKYYVENVEESADPHSQPGLSLPTFELTSQYMHAMYCGSPAAVPDGLPMKSRTFRKFFRSAEKRRIFQASGLDLGLAAREVRCGDLVAVLHGFSCPVVLRALPTAAGEGTSEEEIRYRFMGPCYLEGAMFGERVTWKEEDADVFKLV